MMELYDYDILVKLLGNQFDPASRVSASLSRFHGRSWRHHEDADSFADAITELCRFGYPQSSPELRQELISEQFVRGQQDPELKKYLWVVIRTQKDRKLQTLIEVCTDFASLSPSVNIHRPAEQAFAVEEDDDSEEMFAMMDRSQWTGQGVSEPAIPPSLSQMIALARRMGYEMRLIARRAKQPPGSPRTPFASRQGYRPPFRQGRDFSRIKCFSCGQMGHTQARCPKLDSTLPFKPPGWNMQSDDQLQRNTNLDRDLTQTGLNAIHQDQVSSSDSTHTSEIFNSHYNNDSVIRNSVLLLDQKLRSRPVSRQLKLLIV